MPPQRKDLPEMTVTVCERAKSMGENVVWRARVFKKRTPVL